MTVLKRLQLLSPNSLCAAMAPFYAVVAYLCLQLSFKGTNASPVWFPSGIAFISLWFLGYRLWAGVWLGAFAANMVVFMSGGWTLVPAAPVSALMATGNSLEALAAVFLLRSFTDQTYVLSRIGDIFKFVFAVLVACSLSATIGTSSVYFIHPAPGITFDMIWFTWWMGDAVGMLIIASLFLTFHRNLWKANLRKHLVEAVGVMIVLVAVNGGVFMGKFPEYGFYSHVTYLILPFAIWSTYRFGFPGAILSILITSVIAIMGSMLHLGPFVGQRMVEDLVIVQCFIGVIAVTVLSLAAALYERQQAEEAIKVSEARFRNLVENSFEVIAMIDASGKLLYTSAPTKYILGYENSDLINHSVFEWVHPEDLPVVVEIFQGLVKKPGAIANATCRMKRKDGVWRWMEGSGHNLLHDPAIGAIVVNYRDITDRKLSQQRFERMVEFSPVAKIMTAHDGKIQMVNKMTEMLSGYDRQELLKMNIASLLPGQNLHEEPQAQPLGTELYILRKDGRQVPIEIGAVPIETEEGLCVLASIVDITQRKKAEEILRRDKESLERLVDERSKELIKTQKELRHFSRLADIGTLAATVAHELRNPLGVIHLAAYNLKREKTELNTNKHLTNIEKKVWEGNQIIDNLLSYARIKIPNYEEINIVHVLDECVNSIQGRFAEKGITIEKKYNGSLGSLEADPNQIREIFMNILNNACQSFPGNNGKVEVRGERGPEMVKISVADHGVGIAQEDMDKIFEPFFTRKSKGTGLGLTICNELVNLHQGKIEIGSDIGKGTTVSILLPIHRRNDAEASVD